MQVYDLAWSPSGEYVIAGSTDNCARVFTVIDGSVALLSAFLFLTLICRASIQVNVFTRLQNTVTMCKALLGTP